MTIVISKSKSATQPYYFYVRASNGEKICHSETYVTKTSCRHAAELLKKEAGDASIVDIS